MRNNMRALLKTTNSKAAVKLLLLFADEGVAQSAPPASFVERKSSQLREERDGEGPRPVEAPPTEDRDATPPVELESEQSDGIELPSGEETPEGDDLAPDLDETPGSDSDPDEHEPAIDWEKRFTDTKAELTRVQMDRQEMDSEFSDQMAGTLQLHYQLEDKLAEVETSSGFFINNLSNQITNMEQAFSSGQIGPDQLAQARQHYQQLINSRNQMVGHVNQAKQVKDEAEAQRKKRESEVTRVRLSRSIPGWSRDKYAEMREYAIGRGYTNEQFEDQTDHRFFELIHDSMTLHQTQNTIQNVENKRVATQRVRGQRKPRDGQGRFQKAKQDYKNNPNQKGRFADMKAEQIKRERR